MSDETKDKEDILKKRNTDGTDPSAQPSETDSSEPQENDEDRAADGDGNDEEQEDDSTEAHSSYRPSDMSDENVKHQLTGMYQNWFLDYASYVILERAVPHLGDGLKPVQRLSLIHI